MTRVVRVVLSVVLVAGATSCDPCAGTVGCRTEPRVSVTGRTVVYRENRHIAGVTIEFTRTGGVELASDRVTTTSDDQGWFRLAMDARSEGEVVGDLTVRPPAPWSSYTVAGVRVSTRTIRGDGQDLGRIVVDPYLAVIGELRNLRTRGPLPGAYVEFRRTGGVAVSPGTMEWTTDAGGRFFIDPLPTGFGTVEGVLTVVSRALPKTFVVPVRYTTEWRDRVPQNVAVIGLGTSLVYVGDIFRRGSLKGVPGVEVEFVRTGGVQTDPARVVVRTDTGGRFPIVLLPAEAGEVIGDLIVRPPSPLTGFTVSGLRLKTFDVDTIGLIGRWGIGPQIFGGLELFARATQQPLPGGIVTVFRRRGGIRIDPDTAVERTSPFGTVAIRAAAVDPGEVVGDLEVRLPAPFRADTLRGLRLQSRDDDTQVYLGRAGVGHWLGYVGRVVGPSGAGVGNARIEFRRTAGIEVAQPYSALSNADGYFPLTMAPRAEGEVVGDVVITPPAPLRATTITGVRLQTYGTDDVRFVATWPVP